MSDNQAPSPITGFLLGDQDRDQVDLEVERRVNEYFDVVAQGRREAWLKAAGYPDEVAWSHAEVVDVLRLGALADVGRLVMECESCGRLHVQVAPNVNRYLSFAPEEPGYRGVLRRSTDGAGDSGARAGPRR